MTDQLLSFPDTTSVSFVEYRPSFSVDACSIGKAPFHGEIDIKYYPDGFLLEFEAFDRWLFEVCRSSQTVESLCRLIFDKLQAVLGDIPLRVSVHARTTVHSPVSATIEYLGKDNENEKPK